MRVEHYLCGQLSRAAAVTCVVVSFVMEATAGTIEIPAWAFIRGNGRIHADPAEFADAGPVVGSGAEEPWGWRLEYEVEYPVPGVYKFFLQYTSAEARPMEVFFDSRNVNKIGTGIGLTLMPHFAANAILATAAVTGVIIHFRFSSGEWFFCNARNTKSRRKTGRIKSVFATRSPTVLRRHSLDRRMKSARPAG
jgi:hypothetical protein